MALSYAEYAEIVRSDREMIRDLKAPEGVAECAHCRVPLMESVTGNRRLGDGAHVCSDCYFDRWGNEIDERPLLTPRLTHGS